MLEENLSVASQVEAINEAREWNPKRRFYELVTEKYNPITQSNFTPKQFSKHFPNAPENRGSITQINVKAVPSSVNRAMERKLIHPKFLEKYQKHIDKVRENTDISFDELYHRERQVVQEIILAEAEIKAEQPEYTSRQVLLNGTVIGGPKEHPIES